MCCKMCHTLLCTLCMVLASLFQQQQQQQQKNTHSTIAGTKREKKTRPDVVYSGWNMDITLLALKANGEMRDSERWLAVGMSIEQEGRWFNTKYYNISNGFKSILKMTRPSVWKESKKSVTGIMLFHRMTQSDYPLCVCVSFVSRENRQSQKRRRQRACRWGGERTGKKKTKSENNKKFCWGKK